MISLLFSLLAAGAATYLAMHVARAVMRLLAPDPLAEFLDTGKRAPWIEAVGEHLAAYLPISKPKIEEYVAWAQRGGSKDTVGIAVFRIALFSALGFLLFLQNPSGSTLLLAFVMGYLSYRFLKLKAEHVQDLAVRRLPEVTALLAAELQAGTPIESALERVSALPGPLALLIRDAMQRSQANGRPLLAQQKGGSGTLSEVLSDTRLPAMRAFGVQLDLIAQIGIGGADRMRELSNALASEYRQELRAKVAQLDTTLAVAVSVFFFLPIFFVLTINTFNAFSRAF